MACLVMLVEGFRRVWPTHFQRGRWRTLSVTEINYVQIELEALPTVYGNKLHQFFHGRRCTVVTDHQPLLAFSNIFHWGNFQDQKLESILLKH